nr:hypothetical protein [Bacteroidota bacterium]
MKIIILVIAISSFLCVSCNFDSSSQYTYRQPEIINDGFEIGSFAEVSIDSTLIIKAVNEILRGRYKEVHSMLIFKDGKLVFEEYFKGPKYKWDGVDYHGELVIWDRSMLHCIH